MIEISQSSQVQYGNLANNGGAERSGARGSYRGEGVVQAQSPQSLLQNAAEELTFGFSEKTEKSLAKRKGTGKGSVNIEMVKRAQEFLKQMNQGRDQAEKLAGFLQALKKRGERPAKELLREGSRQFADPTDLYLALSFAEGECADAPGLQSELQGAKAEAMAEAGPAIRAGLNAAAALDSASKAGLGDYQALRQLYRETVMAHEGMSDTYGAIIERCGEEEFDKAVPFLIKAVSDDLNAQGPSLPKEALKSVIDDLYRLEVLGGLHETCGKLSRKMLTRSVRPPQYADHKLLQHLLKLKDERFLRVGQIETIPRELGIVELAAQIYFLRELTAIARLIPEKAYDDLSKREKLIETVQAALDIVIEKEEQEE